MKKYQKNGLILLFPLVVVGQYETAPPAVTDQQYQEEYDKIIGCVRELVKELTHVLDCSGLMNCSSSRIMLSFFSNQRLISNLFHATLSDCLTREAERELFNQCGALKDDNCNRFNESDLKCHITELEKQPNCTWEHVKPHVRHYWAARSSCLMINQWKLEKTRYHFKEKHWLVGVFNPLPLD